MPNADSRVIPRVLDQVSALVTGAASGIGRATAMHFARAGARVALVDLEEAGLTETEASILEAGGEAIAVVSDVSEPAQVSRAINSASRAFGPPLVAFNNAGVEGLRVPVGEYPDEDFDRTFRINVRGVWLCMKAQLPAMLAAQQGSIVNTASALGLVGAANQPAYVASKHAVVGLTRAAALDYAGAGIRVNCICPGVIATPMVTERALRDQPALEHEWKAAQPVGRFGQAEEVAAAALWLCSPEASFVTGHALAVDGGYVAR